MAVRWLLSGLLCAVVALAISCHIDNSGVDRGGAPVAARNGPVNVPPASPPPAAEPGAPDAPPGPDTSARGLPPAPPLQRRVVPAIDQEPRIGVLLANAPQVELTLLAAGVMEAKGKRIDVPAGRLGFTAVTGGLRASATGAQNLGPDIVIHVRGA